MTRQTIRRAIRRLTRRMNSGTSQRVTRQVACRLNPQATCRMKCQVTPELNRRVTYETNRQVNRRINRRMSQRLTRGMPGGAWPAGPGCRTRPRTESAWLGRRCPSSSHVDDRRRRSLLRACLYRARRHLSARPRGRQCPHYLDLRAGNQYSQSTLECSMTTGRLAQLWLERLLDMQEVTCSSQVSPTHRGVTAGAFTPRSLLRGRQ